MRVCPKPAALAFIGLALASTAAADIYVWKDPRTGRTRMTSSPPEWVREGTPGPKVEVIRENRVIDTGTAFAKPQPPAELSESQRAAARLPDRRPAASAEAADAAALAAALGAEAGKPEAGKPEAGKQ